MNEEKLQSMLNSFRLPAFQEIPDVGLYLDQVVKYINSFLNDFPEMHVTPSMISNYVKQKIVSRPYKKTYAREQIAALIFIVCVKTVLSMDHIRECLHMVPTFSSKGEAYTFFIQKIHSVLQSFDGGNITIDAASDNETETALTKIIVAVAHHMYLERYFELRAENSTVSLGK